MVLPQGHTRHFGASSRWHECRVGLVTHLRARELAVTANVAPDSGGSFRSGCDLGALRRPSISRCSAGRILHPTAPIITASNRMARSNAMTATIPPHTHVTRPTRAPECNGIRFGKPPPRSVASCKTDQPARTAAASTHRERLTRRSARPSPMTAWPKAMRWDTCMPVRSAIPVHALRTPGPLVARPVSW